MTNGRRLQKLAQAHRRRKARYQGQWTPRTRDRRSETASSPRQERRLMQTAVCGVIFAVLIALKLVAPGNLAGFRGNLGQWLVRDADFAEAFRAVGRAFGGVQSIAESLNDAYVSVFGGEEATEVMGPAEAEEIEAPPLPAHTSLEREALPFDYSSPLEGTVTSLFGWREDPNTGEEAFHYGLDVSAEEGSPIACFADGTVGVVGESTLLGRYVTVLHEDGFSTLYAHCKRVTAASGQSVAMGEKIAEVGATGNATGPHLHFELHDKETYIDPVYYVTD